MSATAPIPLPQTVPESPPVAAAESRAVAPLRVAGIEAIARTRLLTVPEDMRLVQVAALLSGSQVGVVVVCDADGVALGVISDATLVRHLGLGHADFLNTRAGEVMTRDFSACGVQDLLSDVLALMHTRGLTQALLLDAARHPLGVLNARDGLRALLAAGNHEEALLRNYVMGIGYQ